MSNSNTLNDKLISDYTHNYIGKLFYFSLKKTGNTHEAEDLTSDISLNIISELKKGTQPSNFPAWVWRIARNRYSRWADVKHRRAISVSGADINDLVLADEEALTENDLIQNEELMLLRRELAFITSDYRKIVIAYYIDNMSVKEIAGMLGIPEGTVKSKLYRSRQILKEGMSMAREFGVMSYKPENVHFIMSGSCGKFGEPVSIISRSLSKNILLAAYRTPSTAEELSIELGVALPYMEDELNLLTNATLLKKNGNKYETNFFIVSAKAQEKIFTNLRYIAPELTASIIALSEYQVKCYEDNGSLWHEGYQTYEDVKWALLMKMVDNVHFDVIEEQGKAIPDAEKQKLSRYGRTLRPNEGEWDLLGREDYKGDQPEFVGLHGCNRPEYSEYINFGQFKFNYKGICNNTPDFLQYEEGKALVAVARGDTSAVPEAILEKLVDYGYLKKEANKYQPTFWVRSTEKIKERTQEQQTEYNKLFNTAKELAKAHYDFCRNTIFAEIPDFLKENHHQIEFACASIYNMRGAVLEEALKRGYITYSENDSRRMLGAYLFID